MTYARDGRRGATCGLVGALTVLALSLTSREALAWQGERVVVIAPAGDEGVARLSEELASLSFDATTVVAEDASAPCDALGIFARAIAADAVAAMCIDRDFIRVWIGSDHDPLREAIPLRDAAGGARMLVEVQAVEVLRASLRSGSTSPAPLSPEREMVVEILNAPPKDTAVETSPQPATELRPGYRTARFAVAAGPGLITSESSRFVATADLRATIGITRWLSLAPRLLIPLGSSSEFVRRVDSSSSGTVTMRPALAGVGLSIPVPRATSVLSAELGIGAGLVWMHVAPHSAAGEVVVGDSQDLIAAAAYTEGTASLRLSSHFRVAMGGSIGATGGRFVVRMDGQGTTKTWGVPFLDGSLRAVWMLP